MGVILKHILRNIRENKFRSILIVFALAVSTMVLFLNLTIKDDIMSKYTTVLRGAFQNVDITLSKDSGDDDFYFKLDEINLDGVKTDNIVEIIDSYGVFNFEDKKITVSFIGTDWDSAEKAKLIVLDEKSSSFDTSLTNQIIISKKCAEKYQLKLDDEISILTAIGEKSLKITGIASIDGMLLFENENFFMITSFSQSGSYAERDGEINSLYLDISETQSIDDAIKLITDNNPEINTRKLIDEKSIENNLKTINQLLTIILFVVIFMNFYVISSITKLIMATRIPIVGTFRSVGATKVKMNFILVFENAIYGVVGGAIGIVFGIFLRGPMSANFISAGDAFDYVDIEYDFKVSYLILSVGFSVFLQIIISLSSILKSSKKSIKDTIFNTLSTSVKIKKKKIILGLIFINISVVIHLVNRKYIFILAIAAFFFMVVGTVFIIPILTKFISKGLTVVNGKFFGAPAALGTRNLGNSKTIISSIILLTITLATILMVYLTTESINALFSSFKEIYKYDVMISGLDKESEEYTFLNDIDGIDYVKFDYYNWDDFEINGKTLSFSIIGVSGEYTGIVGNIDKMSSLKDNEAMIDEYYAIRNNFEVGDTITLKSDYFKIKEVTYKIIGMIDSSKWTSNRNVLIIGENDYKTNISNKPSEIQVFSSIPADEMKAILVDEFAGTQVYVQTFEEFIDRQKDSNDELMNMISFMLVLSVILAIFGLMNNQLIGFIQRKKEFAILYSTSMSRSQLRKMIFFEAIGTFTIGCILGTALSIPLIFLMEKLLFSIGMCVEYNIDFKAILLVLAVVFGILSLTSISPMRKISKINIVNEIKYE